LVGKFHLSRKFFLYGQFDRIANMLQAILQMLVEAAGRLIFVTGLAKWRLLNV